MDVPLAPIDGTVGVEHRDDRGGVDVPGRAGADLRVARAVQQERHPADLQVETDIRPDVRRPELEDEARLRLDEVRILVALADGGGLYEVAAHGPCDVVQVRGAGDDLELGHGRRTGGGAQHERAKRKAQRSIHHWSCTSEGVWLVRA